MKNLFLILAILLFCSPVTRAQQNPIEKYPVYETFKTYYLVSGHTTEMLTKGDLFLNISHRFNGFTSEGIQELFGLDGSANIRLELMYGLTENLDLGFGRSSFFKTYDGTLKYRLIRQMEQGIPFSLTLLGNAAIRTNEWSELESESLGTKHRMSYQLQGLISSKLTDFLSLQLMPSYIHRNLVNELEEENGLMSLGAGASLKFLPSVALKIEYYHRFSEDIIAEKSLNHAFGIGIDIANERHSYQLHFTNNTGLIGQEFIVNTQDNFWDNEIHFGFRIVRRFAL